MESRGVVVRKYMYIDFLILVTYPYPSCICSFLKQHPSFKKMCFILVLVLFSN